MNERIVSNTMQFTRRNAIKTVAVATAAAMAFGIRRARSQQPDGP